MRMIMKTSVVVLILIIILVCLSSCSPTRVKDLQTSGESMLSCLTASVDKPRLAVKDRNDLYEDLEYDYIFGVKESSEIQQELETYLEDYSKDIPLYNLLFLIYKDQGRTEDANRLVITAKQAVNINIGDRSEWSLTIFQLTRHIFMMFQSGNYQAIADAYHAAKDVLKIGVNLRSVKVPGTDLMYVFSNARGSYLGGCDSENRKSGEGVYVSFDREADCYTIQQGTWEADHASGHFVVNYGDYANDLEARFECELLDGKISGDIQNFQALKGDPDTVLVKIREMLEKHGLPTLLDNTIFDFNLGFSYEDDESKPVDIATEGAALPKNIQLLSEEFLKDKYIQTVKNDGDESLSVKGKAIFHSSAGDSLCESTESLILPPGAVNVLVYHYYGRQNPWKEVSSISYELSTKSDATETMHQSHLFSVLPDLRGKCEIDGETVHLFFYYTGKKDSSLRVHVIYYSNARPIFEDMLFISLDKMKANSELQLDSVFNEKNKTFDSVKVYASGEFVQ